MKHKTAELTGALLDAAVALGLEPRDYQFGGSCWYAPGGGRGLIPFEPSTDWSVGGPIMEREGISPERHKPDSMDAADPLVSDGRWMWVTETHCGPTMLIAAMRAFVASKLGDEIELP